MLEKIRELSDNKFTGIFVICLALAIVLSGAGLYLNLSHGQYWKINHRSIDTTYLKARTELMPVTIVNTLLEMSYKVF